MHLRTPGRPIALLASLALILAACSSAATASPGGGGASASPAGGVSASPAGGASASPMASESMGTEPSASAGGGDVDLTGVEVTVGSKEFTEQLILGQITKLVLEDAGATVDDQTGLSGSTVVREALTSGEIDMYWEYTGTGWINHLGNETPVPGSDEQFAAVKEADAANGIAWLDPAPFNNTYAIALADEKATELGATKLSDLATVASANADAMTLCAAAEFLSRDDGLPGLEAAYGFTFGDNLSEVEYGLIFTEIDKAERCIFGEVFATDSRMVELGLTVLEDDKQFFPSYQPSLNVKQEVLDANPGIADLFAPVAEALDDETILTLNAKVDVDGEEPADVAKAFLEEQGLMGG